MCVCESDVEYVGSEQVSESALENKTMPSSPDTLKVFLNESQYNIFELTETHPELSMKELESFLQSTECGLNEHQWYLTEQSLQSFHIVSNESYGDDRIARAMNGEVVTDSEPDDPDDYVHLQHVLSEEVKHLIKKRRDAIRC